MLLVFDDRAANAQHLGIEEDLRAWPQTFGVIAKNLNLQEGVGKDFTITLLRDTEVTPERIRQYYASLEVEEQKDGLLFLFSGHGSVSSDGGHYLMLHNRRKLARREIMNLMLRKNAALTVLITDSCGVGMDSPRRMISLPLDEPKGQLMCRSLFYFHRGIVDINSTESGSPAYGHAATGGNFGHAFRRLLYGADMHSEKVAQMLQETEEQQAWQDVTWTRFAKMLALEMQAVSEEQSDGPQQPHIYQLPGGFLGIRSRELPERGRPAGLAGVLVQDVMDGSPAQAIGVRSFDLSQPNVSQVDVIVAINGLPVQNLRDFVQTVDRSDGDLVLTLLNPITQEERLVRAKLDPHRDLFAETDSDVAND